MSLIPARATPRSALARRPLRSLLAALLIGASLAFALWADIAHVRWAEALSAEGSPPPQLDPNSPTGFVNGQRHFLGTGQRGETYRWIAAVQDFLHDPSLAAPRVTQDDGPAGRPQLLPVVYTGWLSGLAFLFHWVGDAPLPLAVEHVAYWEPVVIHLLVILGSAVFIRRRFGGLVGAATALFITVYPLVYSQHLPGTLSADILALYATTFALVHCIPSPRTTHAPDGFALAPTVAAAIAVALNPAYGFTALLIIAGAGVTGAAHCPSAVLRWSLVGATIVLTTWFAGGSPLAVVSSELRYAHPWYAAAWLGLGLGLDTWRRRRSSDRPRLFWPRVVVAFLLVGPLVYSHLAHGFRGWLHSGADLRRLAPIDGAPIYDHLFDWMASAAWFEVLLLFVPILGALLVVGILLRRRRTEAKSTPISLTPSVVVLGAVLVIALFHVRWLLVASLLAVPIVAGATFTLTRASRAGGSLAVAVFLLALTAWSQSLPGYLRPLRPTGAPSARDVEALVFRHFSHWFAAQEAGRATRVMAPPALSDSLVFHGGNPVLLSSAWESHPGHVAAARILSSPEATEAEAVIESVGVTHVVLTSWDNVFPLLVKAPLEQERTTLHDRLQRWLLPPYLRALPYQLPRAPGLVADKVAVFAVVPPQDEALSLSRLAEYFVEVARPEPAALLAETLQQAYPQDPNAAMARALVFESANNQPAFQAEVARLAETVSAERHPADEDRRLLRAIVLALGRRHEMARTELVETLRTISPEALRQLTPRQTFRLRRLVELYKIEFPHPELAELVQTRSAEYNKP